jgi:hypothetical protein
VWAATLTILLGTLFAGLTALTVALWATDPAYAETNPVVDLAFFALGGVLVTGGFASQIARRPAVAGLQQAVLALAALSAAGWLGGRIEPAIGGLVPWPRRCRWWCSTLTVTSSSRPASVAAAP